MLTPHDIAGKLFGKNMNGYNRNEVESYLKEVSNEVEMLLEKNEHLHKQLKSMEGELDRFSRIEKSINDALVVAQSTANQVVHSANERASVILREAEYKAQKIVDESKDYAITLRRDSEDLRKEYEMFKSRLRSMLQSEIDALDKTYPAAPEIKTPAMIQALAAKSAEEAPKTPVVTMPEVHHPVSVENKPEIASVMEMAAAAHRPLETATVSDATKPINTAQILEAEASATKPLQALPGNHPLHVKADAPTNTANPNIGHMPGHGHAYEATTQATPQTKEKLGKLQQEIRRLENEATNGKIALLDEALDAAARKNR